MNLKTIPLLTITALILTGCYSENELIENLSMSCQNDRDCFFVGRTWGDFACVDSICNPIECRIDDECNHFVIDGNWSKCINYSCVSLASKCEQIAKLDYNLSNPKCVYGDSCFCEDYIIDVPRQEIPRNNSVEIVHETYHYENYVNFKIEI